MRLLKKVAISSESISGYLYLRSIEYLVIQYELKVAIIARGIAYGMITE